MGTMAPKAGLIEHTENLVVIAIMPDIEHIRGMMRTSCLSYFLQRFWECEGGSQWPPLWCERGRCLGRVVPHLALQEGCSKPRDHGRWPHSLEGISCSDPVLINRQDLYKNSTKAGN